MSRRPPREARFLGLWTAGWLALLLLAGLLVAGDVTVQWPVFAVPLLWALVAARPRRRRAARRDELPADAPADGSRFRADDPPPGTPPPQRPRELLPPTRETRVLPPLPPRSEDRRPG